MFLKKLSMMFFILACLISLFNGPFDTPPGMEPLLYSLLILFGMFIGYFNITKEQENRFLISSVALILTAVFFKEYLLYGTLVLNNISQVILNFAIFFGSATLIVALRNIVKLASERDYEDDEEMQYMEEEKERRFDQSWDIIVFISVAFMFIIFVLRQFFEVTLYGNLLNVMDFIIWVIFLIDLFFIYSKFWNLKLFAKNAWLDIVAVLPLWIIVGPIGEVARLAKFSRMLKIVRLFSKYSRTTRLSKLLYANKFGKFFSNTSSFNNLIEKDITKKKSTKKKKQNKKKK